MSTWNWKCFTSIILKWTMPSFILYLFVYLHICILWKKVKILLFSSTGERAAPFLRKLALEYSNYVAFANILWTEEDSQFWWNSYVFKFELLIIHQLLSFCYLYAGTVPEPDLCKGLIFLNCTWGVSFDMYNKVGTLKN